MRQPGVRYRVVRACSWSANGIDINHLTPGTLLEANDERVAPAFYGVALAAGWIEPILSPAPERTAAIPAAPETRAPEPTPEPATGKRRRRT